MSKQIIRSFSLANFKAVQKSGVIKFSPLTAFIGNNGSGKSSLVEGLEMLQTIVESGLDQAVQEWRGFENIWNQAVQHEIKPAQVGELTGKRYEPMSYHTNPMRFELRGLMDYAAAWYLGQGVNLDEGFQLDSQDVQGKFHVVMEINAGPGYNEIFIQHERIVVNQRIWYERDSGGGVLDQTRSGAPITEFRLSPDVSVLSKRFGNFILDWQFLSFVPQRMGFPIPQKRAGGVARLAKDGSNIAEYLLNIRKTDINAFEGLLETLRLVLPYAADLQPTLTSELERLVYLQMTEGKTKIPGWLLSTGTLRIVALLAVLRNPNPPPLVVIEEIENGLDPRTIHLIIDEIRTAIETGKTQVIFTTHSPYLLDLLDLSQIVLVERKEGAPVFTRPADNTELKEWSKRFGPGKLYTMNRMSS